MTKKGMVFILIVLVLSGGLGYFAYWTNQKNQTALENAASSTIITRVIKTDDVFSYMAQQKDLKKATALFKNQDTATLMATYPPSSKLVVFAARDAAFGTTEGKHFEGLDATAKADITKYQFAVIDPAGTVELKDGATLTTLSKRQLSIKKQSGRFYIIDAKGRLAKVEPTYVSNKASTERLYITDNILLPQ